MSIGKGILCQTNSPRPRRADSGDNDFAASQGETHKHKTLFDGFKEAVHDGSDAMPLGELLGFRLVEVERGRAVVELESREQHHNPMGILHGCVLATIADTVAMNPINRCILSSH